MTPGLHTNEHRSGETDAYFHPSLNDGIAAFPAEIPMDRDSVLKGKSSPENGTGPSPFRFVNSTHLLLHLEIMELF